MYPYTRRSRLATVAFLAAVLFSPIVKADQESVPQTQAAPPVVQAQPTKEQFLSLVLSKATTYSGNIENAVGKAVDATEKEAPVLAKQFLVWHFVQNLLQFSFALVLLVASIIFAAWVGRKNVQCRWESEPMVLGFVLSLCACLAAIIGICINATCLFVCAEIYFAPHLYLLEQAAALLHH